MKKLLSFVLVLAMLLSVAPVLEIAAEETTATTWTKVNTLEEIGDQTFAITITDEGTTTYVLPVVKAGNSTGSKNIPEIECTPNGNTLTITNTDYSFGWNLEKVEGGYYIKSGSYYINLSGGNNGLLISAEVPSSTFVLDILNCNLLGGCASGKYWTIAVNTAKGGWWTPPTNNNGSATAPAHSSAQKDVLGLWVLKEDTGDSCSHADINPADHKCDECGEVLSECADTNPVDHNCDICNKPLTECGDTNPIDHNCDICNKPLTECSDATGDSNHDCDECGAKNITNCTDNATDGDHICDECGAENVTDCTDANGDGNHNCDDCNAENVTGHVDEGEDLRCDECNAALCDGNHPNTNPDHLCDVCGKELSQCADDNNDHNCDVCTKVLSECTDADGDGNHNCDICNKEDITECADDANDTDHNCDECDAANITECADGNNDHNCDICGAENITDCADGNNDHNCDVCTKVLSECADGNNDHNCDVCTKVLSECADAAGDLNHNCDICNKENLNPCTDADGDKDHICDECGKADVTAHNWVNATIEKPKTCTECGLTEGDPLPLSPTPEGTYWLNIKDLSEVGANDKLVITITIDGVTYILPTDTVAKKEEAPGLDLTGTVSTDGRFLTMDDTAPDCNWTVVPTEGGYYIMAGENYLWVDTGDVGLRVTATEAPTVWNVYACGLLGSQDANGNYRTMCIRDNLWKSFKTSGNVADGDAHSTVRSNVLGLWVMKVAHDCADDDKDHKCDTCGVALTQCADANKDHKCDVCAEVLTPCADAAGDGDHNCDLCGAANASQHSDANNDFRCDECNSALCAGDHPNANNDHLCDVCGAVVSSCADANKDHKCDVCGKVLSECADAAGDKDHKCDICGADGLNECTDAAGDNDHNCDECGKADITAHTWVDATIEKPKTCTECGATEGEPLPLSPAPKEDHWTKVEDLSDIGEGESLVITITIDGVTYVLPNAKVPNSASAPGLDMKAEISEDGRFLTMDSKPGSCNWTVVPTEGGFYIKSGSNYLWVAAGDTGLRISATDAPTIWNVFNCQLLGSQDELGNYRTMCIRDGVWKSFKTVGNTAEGNAHSTVRNNILGLWKFVEVDDVEPDTNPDATKPGATEPESNPKTADTFSSIVFALMALSTIGAGVVISKKKEF